MRFRLDYTGIRVRDMERSIAFYCGVLGLKQDGRGEMSHGGLYADLSDPDTGQRLELNWYPPGSPFNTNYSPGEGLDHLGFEVDDTREAYTLLTEKHGAEAAIPPWTEGDVTLAFVKDPDGIWIELSSRNG